MNTLSATNPQENAVQLVPATFCTFSGCLVVKQKDTVIAKLTAGIEQLQKEKQQLQEDNERLKALLNKGNHTIFSRSSEKQPKTDDQTPVQDIAANNKKRGARFGHKRHGRKIPDLPEVEVIHEIPDDQMYCPICKKPRKLTNLGEVSYEIDYEIRFVRKKYVHKKAFCTCNCLGCRSVTADKPPRSYPRGNSPTLFWPIFWS